MTHHFVTVCVVCVLCAAHTPCSAHTNMSTASHPSLSADHVNSASLLEDKRQQRLSQTLPRSKEIIHTKTVHKTNLNTANNSQKSNNKFATDQKRKSMHSSINKSIPNTTKQLYSKVTEENVLQEFSNEMHDKIQSIITKQTEIMERLGQIQLGVEYETVGSVKSLKKDTPRFRTRRHTDLDEKYFMHKIFESYGDGKSMTMEGFEKLLKKLGLLKLIAEVSKQESINEDRGFSNEKGESVTSPNKGLLNANDDTKEYRCLNSKELLTTVTRDVPYNLATKNSTILPDWLFERVCPVLLYQLAGESSAEKNGCIRVPDNYKLVVIDDYILEDETRNMVQVWVYSTISIVIISLCGLLGVAVIPVMGKSYYHQLLQFLVALAVGTLCGDALIHLLPHAMMSPTAHDHEHESNPVLVSHEDVHNLNMWKGFVAMIGLVLFFFTEKALMVLAEWRKHHQRRNKLPSRVRVMRESTDGQNSNMVGEKLCKHKYSSYPYCYGEITTGNQETDHNHQHDNHERPPMIEEEKPLTTNCNSVSKIAVNEEKENNKEWRIDDSMIDSAKKNNTGTDGLSLNEPESYTVIIREHETKHHGHTHSHGHVHSAPESMSSVAWMVIMGDGLHNFTDGMAIGAAFSANIAGGFSTAIAVFCHELPHELGDFAVLLKAGMSAKQAVFYNVLSSVLCFFGMVVGVLLGSTPEASSWIFAAAAGMFIYIALVDMIPELSSNHSAQHGSRWQCILQGLGLFLGLGIMLIIALYEHDLKHIFND